MPEERIKGEADGDGGVGIRPKLARHRGEPLAVVDFADQVKFAGVAAAGLFEPVGEPPRLVVEG